MDKNNNFIDNIQDLFPDKKEKFLLEAKRLVNSINYELLMAIQELSDIQNNFKNQENFPIEMFSTRIISGFKCPLDNFVNNTIKLID